MFLVTNLCPHFGHVHNASDGVISASLPMFNEALHPQCRSTRECSSSGDVARAKKAEMARNDYKHIILSER